MSTTPKTFQGVNIEGIDWHGPIVDIIDELVERRVTYHQEQKGYLTEVQYDEAYEWGDTTAFKFADSLHPHLEGRV